MRVPELGVVALIAVLICAFTVLGVTEGYPRSAIMFPIIASGLVIVFTIMRVIERRRTLEADAEPDSVAMAPVLGPFLWVFVPLPVVWALGFLVGLPVYVFAYLLAHRISLKHALAVTAGVIVFIHVIFQRILGVLLPPGVLLKMLGL